MNLLDGPTSPFFGFPNFYDFTDDNYSKLYQKIMMLIENPTVKKLIHKNKNKATCDDAFSLFLIEMSKYFNQNLYKFYVIFLKSFRDFLNLNHKLENQDFCNSNSPTSTPLLMNTFINDYLSKLFSKADIKIFILVSHHFCDWLYFYNFTEFYLKLKIFNYN